MVEGLCIFAVGEGVQQRTGHCPDVQPERRNPVHAVLEGAVQGAVGTII